jgi:hypothetical protein
MVDDKRNYLTLTTFEGEIENGAKVLETNDKKRKFV